MSAAAVLGNALLRDLGSSLSHYAIPAKTEGIGSFIVTFNVALIGVAHRTVCLAEFFVGVAFRAQSCKTAKSMEKTINANSEKM